MLRIFAPILAALLVLAGCGDTSPRPVDPDTIATVADAFGTGGRVAQGLAPSLPTEAACKAAVVIGGAFVSIADTLDGAVAVDPVLPGFSADLTVCPDDDTDPDTDPDTGASEDPVPALAFTIVQATVDLVTSILGVADIGCEARVWSSGALYWAADVTTNVLREVSANTGIVDFGGTTIDLSSCDVVVDTGAAE